MIYHYSVNFSANIFWISQSGVISSPSVVRARKKRSCWHVLAWSFLFLFHFFFGQIFAALASAAVKKYLRANQKQSEAAVTAALTTIAWDAKIQKLLPSISCDTPFTWSSIACGVCRVRSAFTIGWGKLKYCAQVHWYISPLIRAWPQTILLPLVGSIWEVDEASHTVSNVQMYK